MGSATGEKLISTLVIPGDYTVDDFACVEFKVTTKSGDELIGHKTLRSEEFTAGRDSTFTVNLVKSKAEVTSYEPSYHEVTRKSTNLKRSPSWPSLQSSSVYQGTTEMNDSGMAFPAHAQKENTAACVHQSNLDTVTSHPCSDEDVTTVSYQPEENNVLYVSVNNSSSHTKGDEKMVISAAFCEGLSGNIDDYSDYSTDEAQLVTVTMAPNIYVPPSPAPIFLEVSPLVIQDGPSQSIVTTTLTSEHSVQYATCYSEVAAPSKMPAAINEGQSSTKF